MIEEAERRAACKAAIDRYIAELRAQAALEELHVQGGGAGAQLDDAADVIEVMVAALARMPALIVSEAWDGSKTRDLAIETLDAVRRIVQR